MPTSSPGVMFPGEASYRTPVLPLCSPEVVPKVLGAEISWLATAIATGRTRLGPAAYCIVVVRGSRGGLSLPSPALRPPSTVERKRRDMTAEAPPRRAHRRCVAHSPANSIPQQGPRRSGLWVSCSSSAHHGLPVAAPVGWVGGGEVIRW